MRASIQGRAVASALTRRLSGYFMTATLGCSVIACGADKDETRFSPATVSELQLSPDPSSSGGVPENPADPIVFRSERDQEGIGDLYVMAADGSNVRRLTEGGDFSMPAWAPDGQSIAFREVTGLDSALGLISSEGGESVRLVTAEDPLLWDRGLAWSGDDIIFGSRQAEVFRLWAVSRSGGQRRVLLPEAEGARFAADVSRVDSRIVFTWDPAPTAGFGETLDLWIAEGPDDAEPENLTAGRVYAPNAPRWSPDGTRVAFHAYVILPDGTVEGFGAHDEGLNPPDSELFMVDVRTRELSRLTDNTTDDSLPTWTSNGTHVIYASGLDGVDEDIWRLAIDGSSDPVNLIDDVGEPRSDTMPNCFWGVAATK